MNLITIVDVYESVDDIRSNRFQYITHLIPHNSAGPVQETRDGLFATDVTFQASVTPFHIYKIESMSRSETSVSDYFDYIFV